MKKKKIKREGGKIKHGGYSFIARGKLPEHRRYLLRYLSSVREGLIRDLGPTEADLTTAQMLLIDRITTKTGVIRCIEEHIRENSVMIGHNLAPALGKGYIAYNNSIRLDLRELGINKKRADETLDVQAYIKQFDEKKKRGRGPKK